MDGTRSAPRDTGSRVVGQVRCDHHTEPVKFLPTLWRTFQPAFDAATILAIADNGAYIHGKSPYKETDMARVTVEDCVDKVENRFNLVLLAAHRARMISTGADLTVDRDNDKNPVVSLREIADETISPDDLKEELIHSLQKYVEVDEPETAVVPLLEHNGLPATGADQPEVTFDQMSEDDLLAGLEGLVPPERSDD